MIERKYSKNNGSQPVAGDIKVDAKFRFGMDVCGVKAINLPWSYDLIAPVYEWRLHVEEGSGNTLLNHADDKDYRFKNTAPSQVDTDNNDVPNLSNINYDSPVRDKKHWDGRVFKTAADLARNSHAKEFLDATFYEHLRKEGERANAEFSKKWTPKEKVTTKQDRYLDESGEDIIDGSHNNGGITDYYAIKPEWKTGMDIIEDREMNYSQGSILKVGLTFNVGRHEGTNYERDLNKIIFHAERELARIKP